MRLTIFGGTGPTGRLLINHAVEAGHDVVAYARTPSKLPTHPNLTAVEGTLKDEDAIAAAVKGADAVLSVLGPTRDKSDSETLVEGYRQIIAAMHAHGVERLVAMGTPSMKDPADGRDLRVSALVAAIRLTARPAYDALVEIGGVIRASGLKWTVIRLPLLHDGPATASFNARSIGQKGGLKLSRANAAAYYLAQATATDQVGRMPFLTDK
ncbi:NAD(P)H-binding protein [Kribbella sp. NPDC005582]|uniref:NAD(P)-dependent oxidoreductase n=1 Tax=Kribbella sp. NPDC005582 TaxID=3156893 RepID=UPI0033B36E95